jgi:hypothetical protein
MVCVLYIGRWNFCFSYENDWSVAAIKDLYFSRYCSLHPCHNEITYYACYVEMPI